MTFTWIHIQSCFIKSYIGLYDSTIELWWDANPQPWVFKISVQRTTHLLLHPIVSTGLITGAWSRAREINLSTGKCWTQRQMRETREERDELSRSLSPCQEQEEEQVGWGAEQREETRWREDWGDDKSKLRILCCVRTCEILWIIEMRTVNYLKYRLQSCYCI